MIQSQIGEEQNGEVLPMKKALSDLQDSYTQWESHSTKVKNEPPDTSASNLSRFK